MANNFDSNFTRQLAKPFLKAFDTERVLSKNVNTQLLAGKFGPETGENADFKRTTDYKSTRTSTGDISGGNASSIITGKATGTVQDYFTVEVDYNEADEALKMGNVDQLLQPAAQRIVTDMETDFGAFMMKNTGLLSGSVGTPVAAWSDIANMGALMQSSGVPMDDKWCAAVNPHTQTVLSDSQRSLGAADDRVRTANDMATISDNFAGMRVMTSTALDSYTTGVGADRVGSLTANPAVTYLAAKDTMTQSIQITGMAANLVVAAGESIQITGRNRLNLSTRKLILNAAGAPIVFTGTVTESVTLDGSGAGTLVITGPAIYEADGGYNTTDSAAVSGDVVTLLGGESKIIQPNMFWHKQAFAIGSVPIKKLYSTDTVATTADGLQIRVSKGASIRENKQIVRFDFRPAYAALNPFFAGQGFGSV